MFNFIIIFQELENVNRMLKSEQEKSEALEKKLKVITNV